MRRSAWSLPLVRPRWLLIGLLVLTSAGCARRDWVSDLLVLTDVTGSWEGWIVRSGFFTGRSPITMVLEQRGPKVTGELSWSGGQGRVEGVVSGEVLNFSADASDRHAPTGQCWLRAARTGSTIC